MQSQQERGFSGKGKASMRLHACNERRELEQNALALHSARMDRGVHPPHIQYGHPTTPQHDAYGHSSQIYNVGLTNGMTSPTSNLMLSSGIHNNKSLDTARNSTTTSSSAAAHRQQALEMYHNSDYCLQMFPPQLQDVTQTVRTSVGVVDQTGSHNFQSVQAQKSLPVSETSCSAVQSTANSVVVKPKGGNSTMASSNSKKLPSKRGRPKRALTAYNIFFKEVREQILADRQPYGQSHVPDKSGKHGKSVLNCDAKSPNGFSFVEMGKVIGKRWKELDREARLVYEERAKEEKRRYRDKLCEYRTNEREKVEAKFAALHASLSEETKQQYFTGRK